MHPKFRGAKSGRVVLIVITTFLVMFDATMAQAAPDAYQNAWMVNVTHSSFGFLWEEANAAQRLDMYNTAESALSLFSQYNLRYGQAVDMLYTDFTRATPALYDTAGDSATWTGHYLAALCNKYAVTPSPALLSQINATLDVFDMLSQCTGKSGYVARFAAPASDSAYQAYYISYGLGYHPCIAPWADRVYLDYSSRDTYTGTVFGLGSVWALVSDTATRNKCKMITERILDRLILDGFWIISPDGDLTNPTPLFTCGWQRLGLSINNAKYSPQYNYASSFNTAYLTSMTISGMHTSDYFANNLTVDLMYVITKLETDSTRKNLAKAKFKPMGRNQHLQPVFGALYMAASGDITENVCRGTLQGGLIDYPAPPKWMHSVNQLANTLYFPHYDTDESNYALLVRDRPQSDYLWQRNPTLLLGGADGVPYEYMTIDIFLPYWLGRQCGAIAAP